MADDDDGVIETGVTADMIPREPSQDEPFRTHRRRPTSFPSAQPLLQKRPLSGDGPVDDTEATAVSASHKRPVMTEAKTVVKQPDRIIVAQEYGASDDSGALAMTSRRSRVFVVACDLSDESLYAMEWTMGTMMRHGDHMYVICAVKGNEEVVSGGRRVPDHSLIDEMSLNLTSAARKTMNMMDLYDVRLTTDVIRGKVKSTLIQVIDELTPTTVVCGTRSLGSTKGALVGSISAFLVRSSPVPVTVVQPKRRRKREA